MRGWMQVWLRCGVRGHRLKRAKSQGKETNGRTTKFHGSPSLSRNFTGIGRWTAAAEGKPWPNVIKVGHLYDPAGDKLILQRAGADSQVRTSLKDFFCGDGAGINASVMLATAQVWHRFAKKLRTFVYSQLLPSDWLANEQMVFKVWVSRNASEFAIVEFACPGNGCDVANSEVPVLDWLA